MIERVAASLGVTAAQVDPEAPLDRACLFACGLSTGLGAAMFSDIKPNPVETNIARGLYLGVIATSCRYRRPSFYDDDLAISAAVTDRAATGDMLQRAVRQVQVAVQNSFKSF